MIFEAKNIPWATDKMYKGRYKGKKLLIIGGGYRGTGPDREYQRFKILDRWHYYTMGCNSAYKVRSLDILVWIDIRTSKKYHDELKRLSCLKFVSQPTIWEPVDIGFIGIRWRGKEFSMSFDEGLYPHNMSGYFAINIALVLGFEYIFLTGFTPHHPKLQKRSQFYEEFAEYIKSTGQQIYVCDNKTIVRDYFPYMPIKEAFLI